MGAYQGHGSVATPHNVLITWALMMEGGFQVNASAQRFSDEHQGYSEQSVAVLAQPGSVVWNIFDKRLHQLGLGFEDYRNAFDAGAISSAPSIEELANQLGLSPVGLAATLVETQAAAAHARPDRFGRSFLGKPPLAPPFYGVKVTGALFHTQGGLLVDEQARVLRTTSERMPNLFAAGGAACGVSGPSVWAICPAMACWLRSAWGVSQVKPLRQWSARRAVVTKNRYDRTRRRGVRSDRDRSCRRHRRSSCGSRERTPQTPDTGRPMSAG